MRHEGIVFVDGPICSAGTWSRLTEGQRDRVRVGMKEALARSLAETLLREGLIEFKEGEKDGVPRMSATLTVVTGG